MFGLKKTLAALLFVIVPCFAQAGESETPMTDPLVCTFSLVACDLESKQWGIVVASRYYSVGTVVPWADADVGAVATQSFVNISFGPRGLDLLRQGKTAEETIQLLLADDPMRGGRQIGVVDAQGNAATYTGDKSYPWAGGKTGKHYACQGNILTGPEVVDAMAKAYEETDGPFHWKLMKSLEAGDAAGGDSRGKQSASILVVKDISGPQGVNDRMIDLRVEDHADPVTELSRILSVRWPLIEEEPEPEPEPAPKETK
ncbi:Uncharacterized conserved protein, Ntn-hydrolase superfamily [Planctomicrobium piriforme]|uniref:Uncharacterized conserved protein, Ntn-hydrolase superfamily n=2 Tax=Planctomicrobium piriforme TaxID=1576369 RepID=A0A1I3BL02_9PLAN|nr:Uncharacterized conserved protein, Ntn-hydrolase superfamily [Planctomicrobium piriforme]